MPHLLLLIVSLLLVPCLGVNTPAFPPNKAYYVHPQGWKRKKERNPKPLITRSSAGVGVGGGADESPLSAMASSALRRSLPRSGALRRALFSNPSPSASAAAGGTFRRSFQSGNEETMEEFEQRLFGKTGPNEGSLFEKLDRVGNAGRRYGMGSGMGAFGNRSSSGAMGDFDSLNDGMSGLLGDAARNFQADDYEDEEDDDDFEFRADVQFKRGSTYNVRDLDLTRPAAAKNPPRPQFETTTKEVLRKADFRNVRFLSNFLTEAGIIIKRSQTRISAKAQRKIAREIKTARAFGLMPFTTMGRRPFIFGRSAEEHHSEEEYGYDFVEEGKPDEDNEDVEPAVDPV